MGHFQWRVLSFGLTNAPSVFSRALTKILQPFSAWCIVYLDDLAIVSRSRAEHLQHLDMVLAKLQEAGLYVNLPKCHFA